MEIRRDRPQTATNGGYFCPNPNAPLEAAEDDAPDYQQGDKVKIGTEHSVPLLKDRRASEQDVGHKVGRNILA